jgi:hypothetical protein
MRNAGLWLLAILAAGATTRIRAQVKPVNGEESRGRAAAMAALPDAPLPRTPAQAPPAAVGHDAYAELSHPLSPGGKFKRAMIESIWPGAAGAAIGAGIGMATDAELEKGYGMGGIGFARRFAANLGQNATDLFVGDFVVASIGHQDPRYHPSPRKGFGRRLGWAISRVFVTQSDSGNRQFNYSHLIGIASGAAIANAWHRDRDRGGKETGERFGFDLLASLGANIGREFWDFRHAPRQ